MRTPLRLTLVLLVLLALLPDMAGARLVRSVGFKAGAVSATQSFDYRNFGISILPTEDRWGIQAGAFVEFFDLPFFSVSTELHYIQKGYSITASLTSAFDPDGWGEYVTLRPRNDYLSLQVLPKFRIDAGMITSYALIGPVAEFLLSGVGPIDYKSPEVGLVAGAGAEIRPGGTFALFLEGRFNPPIQDAYTGEFVTVKNRTFSILAGLSF